MVDGFREGRARQPEASMTGDGCCAADLAVRLPRIRQPGILIHHALLSILRIEVPVTLSCQGVGERGMRKGMTGTQCQDQDPWLRSVNSRGG